MWLGKFMEKSSLPEQHHPWPLRNYFQQLSGRHSSLGLQNFLAKQAWSLNSEAKLSRSFAGITILPLFKWTM